MAVTATLQGGIAKAPGGRLPGQATPRWRRCAVAGRRPQPSRSLLLGWGVTELFEKPLAKRMRYKEAAPAP